MQPKRQKVEPQPRAPYVPKQPQAKQPHGSGKQPQVGGQKRQGKHGTQLGPKGKKQKNNEPEAETEEQPPLPPSGFPPSDDSAAEVDMDYAELVPPPPLPPPSPESHSAVANGYSSGQDDSHQARSYEPLPGPPVSLPDGAQRKANTLPALAASSAPQSRPQVGFKLQGSRRQKLRMVEAEDPTTKAMRERLEQHLAQQQQQQQQQQSLQQQQSIQQQQHQSLQQQQAGAYSQGSLLQQAANLPLPMPGSAAETLPQVVSTQQVSQQGHERVHAVPTSLVETMIEPIPGMHFRSNAQTDFETDGQQHSPQQQQQQQHHSRKRHTSAQHKMPEEVTALPPGLGSMLQLQEQQQPPQQPPQQLPQEELVLPPGLVPEPDQVQPQLQRSQSHRHVHHRRSSRRSHRPDAPPTGPPSPGEDPPQQLGRPHSYSQPGVLQQSGHESHLITEEADPEHAGPGYHQVFGQLAQPAQSQGMPTGNHVVQVPKGSKNGLAGLAERGGPVALANGHAANGHAANDAAGIEVLADDVKSLLRYFCRSLPHKSSIQHSAFDT